MKIAVLGGSFNPLHVGHAMLADTIVKELGYDRVLFVPTFIPPHKTIVNKDSAEDRFNMVKSFCETEGDGHFMAESCEIDRGGTSYTCDTLAYLTEKYKDQLDGKLAFIMGDEVAADFKKWKNPDKIAEFADLIITHRYPDISVLEKTIFDNVPTGDYQRDFKVKFNLEDFGYPCIYMEKPLLPVSSTEIRNRVANNQSYKYLVPQAVYNYIETKGVYR